jgi:hypothetical protein
MQRCIEQCRYQATIGYETTGLEAKFWFDQSERVLEWLNEDFAYDDKAARPDQNSSPIFWVFRENAPASRTGVIADATFREPSIILGRMRQALCRLFSSSQEAF